MTKAQQLWEKATKDRGDFKTKLGENKALIEGIVTENFEFSYSFLNIKFYTAELETKRRSGIEDKIYVTVASNGKPGKFIFQDLLGKKIRVFGKIVCYKTRRMCNNDMIKHIVLHVMAKDIEVVEPFENEQEANIVYLMGKVEKEPVYRLTSKNKREITNLVVLAPTDTHGSFAKVYCIAWGEDARYARMFKVGEDVELLGRIQSRTYEKIEGNGEYSTHQVNEVSILYIR